MKNIEEAGFLPIKKTDNQITAFEFYKNRWQWFVEEYISLSLEIPDDYLLEFNMLSQMFNVKNESIAEKINKYRVSVSDEVPMPEIVLSVLNADGSKRMLMTKQNISCITAQAKVGKTYLLKLIIASLLNKGIFQNKLIGEINHQSKILYIDTEQSKYHVKLGLAQIWQILQINAKEMKRLETFQFDAVTTQERKDFTKYLIYNNNFDVVIIDGISDLALDTNNLQESDELVRDLRVWATEKNCHIINVIHLNPSEQSTKMKGHLGTKLTDKSEIVIGVSVDKENENNRIVQSLATRNKKSDPFEFSILENGLPKINDEVVPMHKITGKKPAKADRSDMDIYRMLCNIYAQSNDNSFMYGKLKTAICLQYEIDFGQSIGDGIARKILEKSLLKSWILKSDEPKFARYFLGEFSSVNSYNFDKNDVEF